MTMRLVGVPTGVPSPPIEHDQAMPSRSAKVSGRSIRSLPPSTAAATDMAIGIIMIEVAVLEIHIDSTAAAAMKPATSMLGRLPTWATMPRAMRSCRRQRSIALATMNPPISSTTTGCI